MNPVEIVTVAKLTPIFKGEEKAENIELVNLEETGFDIISQKGLYKVGDKAVYIQPDYCLPDESELFQSFTAPGGDPNKSRLGKGNRIKALKFNFHKGDNQTLYSMGILLPYGEVFSGSNALLKQVDAEELAGKLGVFKYEAPEKGSSGQAKGDMPLGMYKTDENNFENIKNKIEYPIKLIGTLKVDGSSITCYVNSEGETGICSRSFEKKLDQSIIIGYENDKGNKLRKHFDRDSQNLGWLDEGTGNFYKDVPSNFTAILGTTDDSWVKLGTPVLDKLIQIHEERNETLVARGEISGVGLKGSGNKNNPHAKESQSMLVYGLDDYSTGVTRKLPMRDVVEICRDYDIPMVETLFIQTFRTEKSLRKKCEGYFEGNMVEGIVLRSVTDTSLSCKYMNKEYDSKK